MKSDVVSAETARAGKVFRNFYRDSVALMQVSSQLSKLSGILQASAVMASESNVALLRDAGLIEGVVDAGPNDLLIALAGDSAAVLDAAMAEAEAALHRRPPEAGQAKGLGEPPRSLEMGLAKMPGANLALISTPGDYAAAEAMKALRLGLNVMIFSDNVSLEDEIALKRFALERDLLVMGPDCGTAIINGIPIGFANVVRRGDVGVVAASGTGLQQVTCLLDRLGKGISQAIGTGGHDLHRNVGGITMLQGIEALSADPATQVIVLISKPPAEDIAERMLVAASRAGKPVVVNFLGTGAKASRHPNLHLVKTLEDAAVTAAALTDGRRPQSGTGHGLKSGSLSPGRGSIRGLYSGGTFCYEATMLIAEALSQVHSNTPVGSARALDNVWKSSAHTLLDLGDDVFTRGRPHPMIDHRLRNERILIEAEDPSVAVILLDVVLGYGSHPDPAGEIVPIITEARGRAARSDRPLALVGFVCGTQGDPQNLAHQENRLAEAGVRLASSNAQAVRLAVEIATGAEEAQA